MNEEINEDKLVFGVYHSNIREISKEYFEKKLTADELGSVVGELIDSWSYEQAGLDMEEAIKEAIAYAIDIKEKVNNKK